MGITSLLSLGLLVQSIFIVILSFHVIPRIYKEIDELKKSSSWHKCRIKIILDTMMLKDIKELENKDILTEKERENLDFLYELQKEINNKLASK